MSKLHVTPIFKCARCGNPVKLSYLATTKSDYNSSLLYSLLKAVEERALCNFCQDEYNRLSKENRMNEWHNG